MIRLDTEGYGQCNTTIGDIVAAIEAEVATYAVTSRGLLLNNKMGNNRSMQMEEIQEYIETLVQGTLQTIETEKKIVLEEFVLREAETDRFD